MAETITIPEFRPEPLLDFSKPEVRENISMALISARQNFGAMYPFMIGGTPGAGDLVFERENPADSKEIIGSVYMADKDDVEKTISLIKRSDQVCEWAHLPSADRAQFLKQIAWVLRNRRFELIAIMMFEVGKTAPQADGEFCEAIDFLECYAAYAPFLDELTNKTLISPLGQKNEGMFVPVGKPPICVSIQPWNFPLSISVGPAAAALVMGNSVIYKPAEQSSITGYHLARCFYDAGLPPDIFHFLPGYGEDIGAYLISHPAVKTIAFTGSKMVKDAIKCAIFEFNNERISLLPPKDQYEKTIAALEAGGKNPMIIDSDADLNHAVPGATESAFRLAGELCSATSRLIIVDPNGEDGKYYRRVIDRLRERIESLLIGPTEDPKNMIGPLVTKEHMEKVLSYIKHARQEGIILAEGYVPDEYKDQGYFVPPILVGGIPPDAPLAQEEIFGPVLTVFVAQTFDEAIELANSTEFGLTASIYSRNPKHIAQARRELVAGVIYVEGGTVGAEVLKQPFGGCKGSTYRTRFGNTKAGGWKYLLPFADEVHVSTNTMRHGTPIE